MQEEKGKMVVISFEETTHTFSVPRYIIFQNNKQTAKESESQLFSTLLQNVILSGKTLVTII
jgi:hypothetical protein